MGATARRVLVTLLCVLGLLLVCRPADASFAASASLPSIGVSTGSLQPATAVSAVLTSCNNGRWMSVTVSWTASPDARVTGYVVDARRSDGSTTTVAQVSATTTSASTNVDKLSSGSTTVVFTVTAQLNGWTAVSASSGPISC